MSDDEATANNESRPAVGAPVEPSVRPAWDECKHDWRALVDSMYSSEHQEDVKCSVCGCPGDRTIATGEVFWPAT